MWELWNTVVDSVSPGPYFFSKVKSQSYVSLEQKVFEKILGGIILVVIIYP